MERRNNVYVVEIENDDIFVFETYHSAFNFAIQKAIEICYLEDGEYKILSQENVPDGRQPLTNIPFELEIKFIDGENQFINVYSKELMY